MVDERLHAAWKIVLRNQFHDILPGSSVGEGYEDARTDYDEAERQIRVVVAESLDRLTAPAPGTFTVFNSAPWSRNGVVRREADLPSQGQFWGGDGAMLPAQRDDGCWGIAVPTVPELGTCAIHFGEWAGDVANGRPPFLKATARQLTTPFYEYACPVLAPGKLVNQVSHLFRSCGRSRDTSVHLRVVAAARGLGWGRTVELAWDLNVPWRWAAGTRSREQRWFWVRGVQMDAVKRAENSDDVIVRIHEFAGGMTRVELGSDRAGYALSVV